MISAAAGKARTFRHRAVAIVDHPSFEVLWIRDHELVLGDEVLDVETLTLAPLAGGRRVVLRAVSRHRMVAFASDDAIYTAFCG